MYLYEINHFSWEYSDKNVLAHEVKYSEAEFVELYTKALCRFVERWLTADENDFLASHLLVELEDLRSFLTDELCTNYGFRPIALQATLSVDNRSRLHPTVVWPGDFPSIADHPGTEVNRAFRKVLDSYAMRMSERNKLIYDKYNTED